MNTITLYRIKKNNVVGHSNMYRVSQAYRIMTDTPVQVPKEYSLQGVSMNEDYIEAFERTVMPVIEKHNGDNIIDSWAVPTYEDPDHVTIALCVNEFIVVPDLLCNTTSLSDSPKQHLHIAEAIHKAIQDSENRAIVLPPQDQKWVMKEDVLYLARLMTKMMQVP